MSRYLNSNVIEFDSFDEICSYIKGKYTVKAINPQIDSEELLKGEGIKFFAINFNDIIKNSYGYISIVDIDLEPDVHVAVVGSMNNDKQEFITSADVSYDQTGHMILFIPIDKVSDSKSINQYRMELFVIVFDGNVVPDWISRFFSISI